MSDSGTNHTNPFALDLDQELDQIAFRGLFHSRLTHRLMGQSDLSTLLSRSGQLAVPLLADWCWIDLAEPTTQRLRRAYLCHRQPQDSPLAAELRALAPEIETTPEWQRLIHQHLSVEIRRPFTTGPMALEARLIGADSLLMIPLVSGGELVGVLTLAHQRSADSFPEVLRAAATDLASAITTALDQNRRFEKATQAVRAREEFLSTASHEIKAPLAALKIKLGLIKKYARHPAALGPKDLDLLAQLAAMTEEDVDRLTLLTHRLLDFSRIQAGGLILEPTTIRLSDIVQSTVDMLRPEAKELGCAIVMDLDDSVTGCWDRMRLEQVATNLISNAIKYGTQKPVTLRTGFSSGDTAFLEVEDHGVGIPEDELASVFDPFRRASTSQGYMGVGLGLYIVQQIVHHHGGKVEIVSHRSTGTRIRVLLPTQAIGAAE